MLLSWSVGQGHKMVTDDDILVLEPRNTFIKYEHCTSYAAGKFYSLRSDLLGRQTVRHKIFFSPAALKITRAVSKVFINVANIKNVHKYNMTKQ